MKDQLKAYKKALSGLHKQRAALVKALEDSPISKKIHQIDAILSIPVENGKPAKRTKRSRSGGTVKEQMLAALKEAPKTAKELQQIAGTQYVFIPLSELKKSKLITSDGKRPATFSLK